MALIETIPSPSALKKKLPLSLSQQQKILEFRHEATHLLQTRDKLLLIIGPCSIHSYEMAIAYGKQLKKIIDLVKDTCFIVMRVYIEKPRTSVGWKGFLYQPNLYEKPDIKQGLFLTRKLFLELTDLSIPLAMEFVDPVSTYYFDDLITWGAIGARTSSSQIHRQIASYLPFPVGFKNTIDGNIDIPIQGMVAASYPQTFFGISQEGSLSSLTSRGNPWTHLILRGSEEATNYDSFSLKSAFEKELSFGISSPILIDCSHGNSKKNILKQKQNFLEVLEQKLDPSLPLLGMMLESFLKEGHQEMTTSLDMKLSITDPCIGWTDTEELLMWAHESLSKKSLLKLHF